MTMKIEWGCTPTTNRLRDKLSGLDHFPDQGECSKKYTANKELERFRRAQNVVHDIFNNGLMNRGKQLKILGLRKSDMPFPDDYNWRGNWDRIEEMVEEKFTPIIMEAAKEQGLVRGRYCEEELF